MHKLKSHKTKQFVRPSDLWMDNWNFKWKESIQFDFGNIPASFMFPARGIADNTIGVHGIINLIGRVGTLGKEGNKGFV